MAREYRIAQDLSSRRIIGFACNQGFFCFLLYMGLNRTFLVGDFPFERAELFGMLAFMVVCFIVLTNLSAKQRLTLFARPLLYIYAVIIAAASLIPAVVMNASLYWLPAEGVLLGIPSALLLAAWGLTFGRVSTSVSVPEVFLGALVGALICVVFAFAGDSGIGLIVLRLLPIASVVNIEVPKELSSPAAPSIVESGTDTTLISLKIFAGTLCFGLAAGLVETYNSDPGGAVMPNLMVSIVLFGAFLIGGLSLLLSNGFGRGAALNKSYRLAVFLILAGVLVVPLPLLSETVLSGEAVVLAGYLGLETVLISLFLVLSKITAYDASVTFARGLTALFGGEALGILLANLADAADPVGSTPFFVVVLAGLFVLLTYVFLFTERDFDALSVIATQSDSFEDACTTITQCFKLSKREAEILTYALRGRTSGRIAEELTISKSTVDTHLRRIYTKCNVHSRQELIDLGEYAMTHKRVHED